MITIRTMGGIGNQMFQYAFGVAQAERLGTNLQIDCGPGEDINSYRPFNLGLFDIRVPVKRYSTGNIVRQKGLKYDKDIDCQIKDGDVIFGYWQSEKYFQNVIPQIRQRFSSVTPWSSRALEYGDLIRNAGDSSLMVGIRRDDYVHNPKHSDFHGVMSIDYYKEGIEIVRNDLKKDPTLFIFTDDPEWVKSNWDFGFKTHFFVGDRTVPGHMGREDVDQGLMSLCSYAIIANGTFHWWGAWQGADRRSGVVIAPKKWFRDVAAQSEAQDIVPDRWRRI